MFVQFSGSHTIAAGRDEGSKRFTRGDVGAGTGPGLKRGLVD